MLSSNLQLLDLTHPIRAGSATFPGDPPCQFSAHATLSKDGFRVTALAMGSHQGTHVDAPAHFIDSEMGVDKLKLDQLCGPAHVIDLTHLGEPGTLISVDDLKTFSDYIVSGAKILIKTGWDRQYDNRVYFDDPPSLSVEACEWLALRSIGLLGLDLPTLHATEASATHVPLLRAGTVIVESLKLSALGDNNPIYFFVAPLPLADIDGSPARAFAAVSAPSSPPDKPVAYDQAVQLSTVHTATDMLDALHIRQRVFVDEQGVDPKIEWDALDRGALHLLASVDGTPVGTLRLVRRGSQGTVGRFAVLKPCRGQGIGRAMIQWVIREAPNFGLTSLDLHAQEAACGFYKQAGFRVSGPPFIEAGMPHVPMKRTIP